MACSLEAMAYRFEVITGEDVPEIWNRPPSSALRTSILREHGIQVKPVTVIELPDHPMSYLYRNWHISQPVPPQGLVGLIITNFEDFETARGPGSGLESIRKLVMTGRPSLFFIQMLLNTDSISGGL